MTASPITGLLIIVAIVVCWAILTTFQNKIDEESAESSEKPKDTKASESKKTSPSRKRNFFEWIGIVLVVSFGLMWIGRAFSWYLNHKDSHTYVYAQAPSARDTLQVENVTLTKEWSKWYHPSEVAGTEYLRERIVGSCAHERMDANLTVVKIYSGESRVETGRVNPDSLSYRVIDCDSAAATVTYSKDR